MSINNINCYAYVERVKNGNKILGQCMYKKLNLENSDSIFCEKHQNIFNLKGKLKNGFYKPIHINIELINEINTTKQYEKYSNLKKELIDNNNYAFNKLKKKL